MREKGRERERCKESVCVCARALIYYYLKKLHMQKYNRVKNSYKFKYYIIDIN